MRLNVFLFIAVLLFTFAACEGPPGPRGPEGVPGEDGRDGVDGADGEDAYTFDFTGVDFTSTNDYMAILEFPEGFQMRDSEVALVYMLWGETDNGTLIWRALPQTIIFDNGDLLQYNYDFTVFDVSVFLDSNFDLNTLEAIDTDDWTIRVVVVAVPEENGGRQAVNLSDYNAVVKYFNIKEKPLSENHKHVNRRPTDIIY